MSPAFRELSRKAFLKAGATSLTTILAHRVMAASDPIQAPSTRDAKVATPRILSLELLTSAPLARMKAFYERSLGLRLIEEREDRLTVAAGATRLTFLPAGGVATNPFYHFAFNIPENKIVGALEWQRKRSALLPIPEALRDPDYPNDVVDYRHWNAHSIFFYDPAGNVVEYIARHDLKNAEPGGFGSEDILGASEIAFVVDDVPATASQLKQAAGVHQYRGGSEEFTAVGDELGLLLVMRRGRVLNFNAHSEAKAAAIFPTLATVRGVNRGEHVVSGFPYRLAVEG